MAIKKVDVTKYFVTDWDAAVRFYRDALGLRELTNTPGWAVYEAPEGGKIAIIQEEEAGNRPHVSVDVSDLKTYIKTLEAKGVEIVVPLEHEDWGDHAIIADPDGNRIFLIDLSTSKYARD